MKGVDVRPTVLLVYNAPKKFVQLDRDLLKGKYDLREWYQRGRSVNLFRLIALVRNSDIVFAWFASWHSLFPLLIARIRRIPSILVVGGFDTANMPEIGYGSQRGGYRKFVSRLCMLLSEQMLTFSQFSLLEALTNARVPSERIRMAYLGLPDVPAPAGGKKNIVLTVGEVEESNLKRKGLECFVRAAVFFPEWRFIVAGAWKDRAVEFLRSIATPNVEFTGWLSDDRLANYFAEARIYVQASQHEGFGLAVAEAMLVECVPVVSRVGSLPELVGDAGIYIDAIEPEALARGITSALRSRPELGKIARNRIQEKFGLEQRRAELYAIADQLLTRGVRSEECFSPQSV